MKVTEPGLYQMTAADYHADPTPDPSLSSSIARALISLSPLHARWEHSRLNPAFQRKEKEAFDLGTAAHAYLLEGNAGVEIINHPDWRTEVANAKRAAARLAGKIPLLAHKWAEVQAMVRLTRMQLERHEDPPIPFTAGRPEQTLIWREQGVWCRARLDWLHDDRRTIDDYKTTGTEANPETWCRRQLFDQGYDIQAAFYLRGVRAVFGPDVDPIFRFIVQENYPPYALAVVALGPDALVLAEKKVLYAIEQWSECLNANRWPGYPTRTCFAQLAPWQEAQWLERELREEGAARRPKQTDVDDGRPADDQLAGMGDIR